MPTYDFECKDCTENFEDFAFINDRGDVKCPKCDGETKIVHNVGVAPHIFREGWYEHVSTKPLYITSKRQLLDACKKESDGNPNGGIHSPFYG